MMNRIRIAARVMPAVLAALAVAGAVSAASAAGLDWQSLKLSNGWKGAPFQTRKPEVSIDKDGIVRFRGALSTNKESSVPFVLPSKYRPSADVYIPVDMCAATYGHIVIQPDGNAIVKATDKFSNAQCFVSLEGASFSK